VNAILSEKNGMEPRAIQKAIGYTKPKGAASRGLKEPRRRLR
jgi:hypothetical protein